MLFRRIRTIGRKITLVTLLATSLALVTATAAFLSYHARTSRAELSAGISALAGAVGTNCASALVFLDPAAAAETLRAFEAVHDVQMAVVYDARGEVFASYHAEGAEDLPPPPAAQALPGLHDDFIAERVAIAVEGDRVGALWVRASLAELHERRLAVIAHQAGVGAAALVLAMLGVAWMLRHVTGPLHELTGLAVEITRTGDHGRRAREDARDEVGELARAINSMLTIIQWRDQQLLRHRDELERTVASRTTELEQANARLQVSTREAQGAAQAKAQFLANMSHEIRTPMNGVMGMATLLAGTALEPRQKEMLGTIRTCADDLLRIINEILDFSKIEAGKLELEAVPFDVAPLFDGVGELFSPLAAQKGLELSVFVDPRLPSRLVGDPGRIRQITQNFLGNALKFTSEGEVSLRVTQDAARDGRVTLLVEVRDTGIGIPEDRRHRLFTEFSQVDASNTRKYGGTGLGLAICKRLAEAMGGDVGCTSREGHGSRFWASLTLPVSGDAAPPVCGVFGEQPVVVVAGPDTLRENLTAYLEAWGCRVLGVERAAEALDALRRLDRGRGRLPLLVLVWPGDDEGHALVRQARASPDARPAHMVVLVPADSALDEDALGSHGDVSLLSRPLRVSLLFNCISDVLHWRRSSATGPAPAPEPFAQANGMRVLVVEDNAVNQRVAVAFLEQAGYVAEVAGDGQQALQLLEREAFDVVLMDCQMPVLDGFAATAMLRAREREQGGHQVVVALTAHALADDAERCRAAGMDDYLAKPVRPEALYAVLERWRPVAGASG